MRFLLKENIKSFLVKIKHYVLQRPKLKKLVIYVLAKFPQVKARLTQINLNNYSALSYVPADLVNLTPHARQIYANLKTAIKQQQKVSR